MKIYRQSVYICISPFVMWLYWIVSPIRLTDAWVVEHYGLRNSSLSTPAGIYLFKVNKRNNRTMCEICSKLTIKIDVARVSLLLALKRFHTLFWCFYCWLWTSKWRLNRFHTLIWCFYCWLWKSKCRLESLNIRLRTAFRTHSNI